MSRRNTISREFFATIAAVLVLGVSDRSVKTDAGFEPMDAIPHMLGYQRGAAENTGAAFWPTCDAMRSLGGMEQFVANGWAGKDFTHINYAGGRRVAWSLFDALNAGAFRAYTEAEAARIRRQAEQAVLDSLRRRRIERDLIPGIPPETLNAPLKCTSPHWPASRKSCRRCSRTTPRRR